MCQRVAIAASMINSPKLLLGDEPTSALDVTSQEEVVNQLKYLKNNFKVSAVIISHNIGVISMLSDDMAVMYGGKILEYGKTENVLYNPSHPYTKALIEAMPDMDGRISGGLTGSPPVFTKAVRLREGVQRLRQDVLKTSRAMYILLPNIEQNVFICNQGVHANGIT